MYMTSVLWSDNSEIVVYRSFQDFKKMHVSGGASCWMATPKWVLFSDHPFLQKQVKKAFPPASKLHKADRIIPRFRGACA